jgi:hypothetical protein
MRWSPAGLDFLLELCVSTWVGYDRPGGGITGINHMHGLNSGCMCASAGVHTGSSGRGVSGADTWRSTGSSSGSAVLPPTPGQQEAPPSGSRPLAASTGANRMSNNRNRYRIRERKRNRAMVQLAAF